MAGLAVFFVVIVVVAAFQVLRAPRSSLRRRVGAPVLWLVLFAGGLELALGVSDGLAGAVGVGCLTGAVLIGLASERSRFEPLVRVRRRVMRRVKPALFFIVGDWEDDVGFAGDGRKPELKAGDEARSADVAPRD